MTITRIKWLLIACIAFWLVVFTIAPVFANWNDDPTHPDYQNQDQSQSQSKTQSW